MKFWTCLNDRLSLSGAEPVVSALYPEVTFPVPRNTPGLAQLIGWVHNDATFRDLIAQFTGLAVRSKLLTRKDACTNSCPFCPMRGKSEKYAGVSRVSGRSVFSPHRRSHGTSCTIIHILKTFNLKRGKFML